MSVLRTHVNTFAFTQLESLYKIIASPLQSNTLEMARTWTIKAAKEKKLQTELDYLSQQRQSTYIDQLNTTVGIQVFELAMEYPVQKKN